MPLNFPYHSDVRRKSVLGLLCADNGGDLFTLIILIIKPGGDTDYGKNAKNFVRLLTCFLILKFSIWYTIWSKCLSNAYITN